MDREFDVGAGARLIVLGIDDDGSVANVDVEVTDAHGARPSSRWVRSSA
jgi:hypothetical protein